jgi:dTMP kinase
VKRGSFVVLEGIDGSGKSTQLRRLAAALEAAGHAVLATHEPSDGPIGRRIREMARSGETLPPEQELERFMEDRAEHLRDVIQPALAAGRTVVCDRYYLSTVAYQGARGLDWRAILSESETRFPQPDLALILEIDAASGLARTRTRGEGADPAFENLEFLERVAAIFAAIDRPWIKRIDASGDLDSIAATINSALTKTKKGDGP